MLIQNCTNQYCQNFFGYSFPKKQILSGKISVPNDISVQKSNRSRNSLFEKIKTSLKNYFCGYPERISYTSRHKKAFLKVEKELTGKNTLDGYLHDMDKLLMYIFGVPKNLAHRIHIATASHHIRNNSVKKPVQTVIDWECARLTKPDKPYNANDFYHIYYVQQRNIRIPEIEQVLKEFGLWNDMETKI